MWGHSFKTLDACLDKKVAAIKPASEPEPNQIYGLLGRQQAANYLEEICPNDA